MIQGSKSSRYCKQGASELQMRDDLNATMTVMTSAFAEARKCAGEREYEQLREEFRCAPEVCRLAITE